MDSINKFLDKFPELFQAIILLIVAFLVAWLAKAVVVFIAHKLKVDERLGPKGMEGTSSGSTSGFLGTLAFLIVFLLFLPAALDRFGMPSVSDPIKTMIHGIFDYLPNIIAAALILFIGHIIAKLIGQLLEAVLQRAKIDRVQTKLGMEVTNQNSLASVLGKVAYGIIMIFVAIAALQALDIKSISQPAVAMLHEILDYMPLFVMGLVLVALGFLIGHLIGRLVTNLLSAVGADSWPAKLMPASHPAGHDEGAGAATHAPSYSLSKIVGEIVRWLIVLFFFIEGLQVLRLDLLTDIGAAIIGYLPSALAAAVILVLAVLAGNWVESLIVRRSAANRAYGVAAKVVILVIAAFMVLTQLHLGETIVTIAFFATVGAVAVAFAIAFGVGGRSFAANRLSKLERKLDEPAGPSSGADSSTGSATDE